MQRELLTVREVAAALKISPRQVWKLRAVGRLPMPVKLSRSVRWRATDIELFVQAGCDMGRFKAEHKRTAKAMQGLGGEP